MPGTPDTTPDRGDVPFTSAEQWLAERGVTRDPIRVAPAPPAGDDGGATPPRPEGPGPSPSAREAARLATEAPPAPPEPDSPSEADAEGRQPGTLEDELSKALAFIRRSTAAQPAAEARLRRKLADRDTPRVVIDRALERARAERLVDDGALVAALVEERRAKGHAPLRIRQDLRKRELPDELIDAALDRHADEDPEALAFDVARRKASSYHNVEAETAYRRLVGYLARRGHPEGLARKVARQVIWVDREHERTVGH